jgi:hypothetical protein
MPITKKQADSSETPVSAPAEQEEDFRFYKLSEPLSVGNAEIVKLLIDKTELKGQVYFKLNQRYQNENPDSYRNCLNRLTDTTWMAYQLAELNPPMILEDVYRIPFYDLEQIFARMPAVSFLTRTQSQEKA